MKLAVLFSRFGPYHRARVSAAARRFAVDGDTVVGLEVAGDDRSQGWSRLDGRSDLPLVTLFPGDDYLSIPTARIVRTVGEELGRQDPDVVAINGWSLPEARAGLAWCRRHGRAAVLMSTSQADDSPRSRLVERVKAAIVAQFDAAFVGGATHRDYLVRLGIDARAVVLGYNAVDNDFFAGVAAAVREREADERAGRRLPGEFFLVSSRLVAEKNLDRLLRAYAAYAREVGDRRWGLVICGDGPLRGELERLSSALGITADVDLRGLVRYDELARYYALAGALVLPSLKDTWGLVVNEAMAAGLPAIVSRACGCAAHLVRDSANGYLVDPAREAEITAALVRMTDLDLAARVRFSEEARRSVDEWSVERFAQGLREAAELALARRGRFRLPLPWSILCALPLGRDKAWRPAT